MRWGMEMAPKTSSPSSIDLDHLNRYVFGDKGLLDEVLTIFSEQAEQWLERLDLTLEDSAWKDAAHTLKGAARGVGSWTLGDLCEEAEKLVGGVPEKTGRRRALLASLKAHVEEAIAEANRLKAEF